MNSPALILIIDDDQITRLQVRRAMERAGYRVEEATNGEEGLLAYMRLKPDIVLLDAIMPQMDGFNCCARLHTLTDANPAPVLMITGLEDKSSVDRAFEVGATDYVVKPIHWPVLLQRVNRIIKARQMLMEQETLLKRQRDLYKELEAANRELRRLASLDGLTQIANRRCFDEILQQEWQRLKREKVPVALILCDIDYFKGYNDTYGHQAGDECLKKVAQLLRKVLKRPADFAARYGGEEFVILLPNTDNQGAAYLAEVIRGTIKAMNIAHQSSKVGPVLTLSFGFASTVPTDDSTPEMLLKHADEALYRAKAAGRDRVMGDSLD